MNIQETLDYCWSLQNQGEASLARKAFQKIPFFEISEIPHFKSLALLALKLEMIPAAKQTLERAWSFFPVEVWFGNNLATIYLQSGHVDQAKSLLEKVLQIDSDYAKALINYGLCFEQKGELQEASFYYQKSLSLEENQFEAHLRLALISERLSDVEQLKFHSKRAYDLNPHHPDSSYVMTFHFLRSGQPQKALQMIDQALSLQENNPTYSFLKGRVLDERGAYEQAYQVYEQANQFHKPPKGLKEALVLEQNHICEVLQEIQSWIPDEQQALQHNPIFILSCPRSGSSLLSQILGSHSKVENKGEMTVFEELFHSFVSGDPTKVMPGLMKALFIQHDQKVWNDLQSRYKALLDQITFDPNKTFYIDKGIMNSYYLPLIAALHPRALFVHLLRDPREVAYSIFKSNFSEFFWFKSDWKDALSYYQQDEKMIKKQVEVFNLNSLEICYEDLVTQPKEAISKILNALGLGWEESCLEFYKSNQITKTASYAQVKEPLHQKAVGSLKEKLPRVYDEMTTELKGFLPFVRYE